MDPEDESGGEEIAEGPEQKKKKQKKKTSKKKAAKPKAKPRVNDGANEQNGNLYKPGEYAQERRKFLAEAGVPYKEACVLWDKSARKAELLSCLSRKELIRRRFLKPDNPKPKKAKA